ncbi:MAG: hypothetical protein ACP5E4_03765 [Candidatus Aenigmatarchaeota archaeon]
MAATSCCGSACSQPRGLPDTLFPTFEPFMQTYNPHLGGGLYSKQYNGLSGTSLYNSRKAPEWLSKYLLSNPAIGYERPAEGGPKVVPKRLPKGVGGATPIKCDGEKCVPAGGEVYIDPSQGDAEHSKNHEITHWKDLKKYPYLIHGIAEKYKGLVAQFAKEYGEDAIPRIVTSIYEALTDYRTIQDKCREDRHCGTAREWFNDSGYRPWMELMEDLRKYEDLEDLMREYNDIGKAKAEVIFDSGVVGGPYGPLGPALEPLDDPYSGIMGQS